MNSFDNWNNELYHHGIKGQKWGIRRYQNPDGSLTAEGEARYGEHGTATARERARFLNKLDQQKAHSRARMGELSKAALNSKSAQEKVQQYSKLNSSTDKTIKTVIQAAKKNNMNVYSSNVTRHANTGRTIAKTLVKSGLLSAALTAAYSIGTGQAIKTHSNGTTYVRFIPNKPVVPIVGLAYSGRKVKGTKYKVKDDRNHKE